jgi:hypothetical protein
MLPTVLAVLSVVIILIGALVVRSRRTGYAGWFIYANLSEPTFDWVEMQGLAKPFKVASLIMGEHSMNSYNPCFPHTLPESVTVRWKDSDQSRIDECRVALPESARTARDGMILIVRRSESAWDATFYDKLDLSVLHGFHDETKYHERLAASKEQE